MADRPVPSTEHRTDTLQRFARDVPGLDASRAELGVLLWSSAVQVIEAFDAHFRRLGLSPARFAVLLTLHAAEGHRLRPSELGDRIRVSRPTVTGIVDGLVTTGLVRRLADPASRRNQQVELTAGGRRLIRSTAKAHFLRLARVAGAFTGAEQRTLRRALPLLARFAEGLPR